MANILVVERDGGVRDGVLRLMSRAGHNVVATPFGRIALKLDEATPFDIVLIGRNLPDLDGFRLLRAFTERPLAAATPVIMLLTADKSNDAAMSRILGAWDAMDCPPVAVEVLYKVGRALEESGGWRGWAETLAADSEGLDSED